MENTFWDTNRDSHNFVEIFKKSFTLYVESGMKEATERDYKMLRGEFWASTRDHFNAKFYEFIVDHYLPQPQAIELE